MTRRRGIIVGPTFWEVTFDVLIGRRLDPVQCCHLRRDDNKTCCGITLSEPLKAGSVALRACRDPFFEWWWLMGVKRLCYRCRVSAIRTAERALRAEVVP